MCEVEEDSRRALKINIFRMFSIKQQGMAYCDQCKLPEHNTVSNTAIRRVKVVITSLFLKSCICNQMKTFGTHVRTMMLEDDGCVHITHSIENSNIL